MGARIGMCWELGIHPPPYSPKTYPPLQPVLCPPPPATEGGENFWQRYTIPSNIVQYPPPPQPINTEVAKPLSAPSGCTKLAFFGLIPLSFPQLALHSNKQWINALINMMFIYGISAKIFDPILDDPPPLGAAGAKKSNMGFYPPPTAQKHTPPPLQFRFYPPPLWTPPLAHVWL